MPKKELLTLKYNEKEDKLNITGYGKDSIAREALKTATSLEKKIDENGSLIKKISEINENQKLDETSVALLTETLCFLYEIDSELG